MRRMLFALACIGFACTEPASYQSRAENLTDDTMVVPRSSSGDEDEREGRDASQRRRIVQVRMVDGLTDARSIHGTCAVRSGGDVRCWGEGPAMPAVRGASTVAVGGYCSPRERVAGLEGVVSLSSDQRRFCARERAGETTCWTSAAGDAGTLLPRGELVRMEGGATAESVRPIGQVDVQGNVRLHVGDSPSGALAERLSDVVELSDAECARLRDGRVACWGDDERYAEGVLVEPPPPPPEEPSANAIEMEPSANEQIEITPTEAGGTIERGE